LGAAGLAGKGRLLARISQGKPTICRIHFIDAAVVAAFGIGLNERRASQTYVAATKSKVVLR
jgi:hypothetical protein